MESIGEERWNLLQRNVAYHLTVSDVSERYGDEGLLGDGRLVVTIECSGCGFLKIGPAVAALEEEAEGLGAAFYWTYALYRVMRIYNHDDALQYDERMHEYAADDAENASSMSFPKLRRRCQSASGRRLRPTTITHSRGSRAAFFAGMQADSIAPGSRGCARFSNSRGSGYPRLWSYRSRSKLSV